ncbi:unnamed protein product (macronuclear) [Paramecium tetraurelia]|uniref:KATNIP domain-containing protein n=1 Tax=Paramecium tetraurelia TaxID=5888 RepID=A0DQ01_PARTE|nr:uncharacterized protein GSPATT00002518001 [Paramecium tetraurelia]CAK85118.1 unnamed protein product [Paramecium tetraurelia]|eukprot:XP_001452515.1 hypothetical protein (macronuclear) [Paramecium tetraurelia strain d4-2]
MQQQLIKPQSKEHAMQILQSGFQLYQHQGHMSFNENAIVIQQPERMSFNDQKMKSHPKVHNVFENQKRTRINQHQIEQSIVGNKFEIPVLPSGKYLKFNVLSNWGDKQQVGLNGIEVFDSQGGNITRYIKMPMQDEYIEKLKLIDGYQAVKDDKHIWKTKNLKPEIIIDLTANIKVSLIRIWNYNKSRIRSYKGVRLLKITLDERLIFYGDIQKATGDLKKFQDNCEYILFTQDSKIISRIAELDWLNKRAEDYSIQILQQTMSMKQIRPNTGTKLQSQKPRQQQQQNDQSPSSKLYSSRIYQQSNKEQEQAAIQQRSQPQQKEQEIYKPSNKQEKVQMQYPEYISVFDILLEFNNGSKRFLGLNGILLIDYNNKQIHQEEIQDSNLTEYEIQRLFYSNNPTQIDSSNMIWIKQKRIYIKFKQQTKLSMIKFYNCNQIVSESTFTGPEIVKITYNGRFKIFNLRPAPCEEINFVQTIQLTQPNNNSYSGNLVANYELFHSNYVIAYPPCGMIVTIYLINTWGDNNYVGLNGLEIYDHQGSALLQRKLIPYTIHSVPQLEDDPRVVQNLVIPPYDINCQPQRSFLAPFINTPMEKLKNKNAIIIQKARDLEKQDINKIYVLFDKLTCFSGIDFYNYTKDWQRGVKEVHIYVNNRLIYQGNINQTFQDIKKNIYNKTTILFSDSNQIKQQLNPHFYQFPDEQVSLIDENKQLTQREYQQYYSQQLIRPKTSIQS